MERDTQQRCGWWWIAVVMIAAVALWSRVPGLWRIDLVNDEMHHLESWRNRYGTDDVYPLFLERIKSMQRFSPSQVEFIEKVYRSSPLVQRGLIVLVDPQPPTFPVFAEVVQAVSDSNLLAIRLPSLLLSFASLVLIYQIGVRLRDSALGLWLAALLAIGFLAQTYAVIGRPYALTQFAMLWAVLAFIKDAQEQPKSPMRLLLISLFAQSVQWMLWPMIGVLVGTALLRRWRTNTDLGRLFKQTWWYILISVLLLGVMAVQLVNPTVSSQAGEGSGSGMWLHWSIASPLAHLSAIELLDVAGLVFAAMTAIGAAVLLLGRFTIRQEASKQWGSKGWMVVGVVTALVLSVVTPMVVGSSIRFMMSYATLPLLFMGLGVRALLGTNRTATIAAALFALICGGWFLFKPEDPYRHILFTETDYSQAAALLQRELRPDEPWAASPYFKANCLYPFGEFPEPAMLNSADAVTEWIEKTQENALLFIWRGSEAPIPKEREEQRWTFRNDHALVRLRPSP